MTKILNKTALITGGVSGIGLLTGRLLLEKGLQRLIIWDLKVDDVLKKIDPSKHFEDKIIVAEVDISDVPQLSSLVEMYSVQGWIPDILINNAGIVVGKNFVDHTLEDIRKTIDVNIYAHMVLTRLWLPLMMKKRKFIW